MWMLIAEAAFLIGDYIYHRYEDSQQTSLPLAQTLTLPTSLDGSSISLFYGTVRIRAPIMAGWGEAITLTDFGDYSEQVYGVNMFFNVGIPFDGGTQKFVNVYAGELELPIVVDSGQTGDGGFETPYTINNQNVFPTVETGGFFIGGQLEFLNGNAAQNLVDPGTLLATTNAGKWMIDGSDLGGGLAPQVVPGYRGYSSVLLFGGDSLPWIIGGATQPDAYSFEMSSFPASFFGPSDRIGEDANPADVIYDILTGTFGKLGLDASRVDGASFNQAAHTLDSEGNGYSREVAYGQTAGDVITDILKQVDGLIYEDPLDKTIHLKLIRSDWDPTAVPVVSPANCSELQNFAASGWTDVPNKIQVVYTDRSNFYRDGAGSAQNQANAVGQDGEVRMVQLQMPGVTTQALADQICSRELAAQSKPQMKCRAICDRTMLRVLPGDVVMLNWPEANISRVAMRVAAVGRGTLDANQISLDLIQDYFYQWRNFRPVGGGVRAFPGGGDL